MRAIWPAGPPNETSPIFAQTPSASRNVGGLGAPDGYLRDRVRHVIPAQAGALGDGQLCVSSTASRDHR